MSDVVFIYNAKSISYAQDIVIMARAHMTYLSFVIYKDVVKAATFKD